jgi:hypothetical protein
MIRGQLLCLILLLAWPGSAGAAEQAGRPTLPISAQHLTLQQYVSELDGSMAILSGGDPAASRKWLATLPKEWVVETEERSYHVKTDWLRAALEMEGRTPHNKNALVEQAKLRLASLREAAQALQAPAAGEDLRHSRTRLDKILNAREFRGARGPSYYEILRARTLGWIQRQLAKIFGRMRRSPTISGLLAWGLIAIAALLLAYWAVRASIGSRVQIDLSGRTPVTRGWRDWLRDARSASERGDFRAAIHAAYWAAVARLVETQILPEDRSRTPRESLRLVDPQNQAHPPLARLTSRLELVWYGYFPATASDWNDAAEQLEALECLASSIPKTPGS